MISDFDDVARKLVETADDVQSIIQRLSDLAAAEAALQNSSRSLSDAGSALAKLTGDVGATTTELRQAIAGLQEAIDAIKASDPAVVRDTVRDMRSHLSALDEAVAEANKSITAASSDIRASVEEGGKDVKSQIALLSGELEARGQQLLTRVDSLRHAGRYGLVVALGILAACLVSLSLTLVWHAH
ncbi:MAG TPA: hypothetical protein VFF63_01310 [Candidatus Babeliales bacterium]|nr:hypothetical protein [Candidatus Babeliales bacterium]